MANGDIFYSRLSFGTIQQQFFGIFQFLKGGSFSSPPGTQRWKKTLVLKGLTGMLQGFQMYIFFKILESRVYNPPTKAAQSIQPTWAELAVLPSW